MRAVESHRERFLPYPELVEKRGAGDYAPYLIVDSLETSGRELAGAVDKVARRLAVPLEPDGRSVILHEYGHVLYSPLVPPKVAFDPRVAAAVEDARVNLALRASGRPVNELGEAGELYVSWLLALDAKRDDAFQGRPARGARALQEGRLNQSELRAGDQQHRFRGLVARLLR